MPIVQQWFLTSHWQKSQVCRFIDWCSGNFGPRLPENQLYNNKNQRAWDFCHWLFLTACLIAMMSLGRVISRVFFFHFLTLAQDRRDLALGGGDCHWDVFHTRCDQVTPHVTRRDSFTLALPSPPVTRSGCRGCCGRRWSSWGCRRGTRRRGPPRGRPSASPGQSCLKLIDILSNSSLIGDRKIWV